MSEAAARKPRKGLANVARNLGWMLASRGVTAVLSLVYLAIVTRTLGVTNFGRFAIIVGASQVLAVLVGFQTWQIIVRYGTAHLAAGDHDRLARLFHASAALDAASAVVGAALSAVILFMWGDMLGIGPTLWRATLVFTIVQLLSLRSTPLGILRLHDRFSLAAIAESTTPIVRLVGAGLIALLHPTLQGFLVAWMAAELLTAAAYWIMVARTGRFRPFGSVGRGLKTVFADNPGIIRFAITTNANSTLSLSGKQIPLLLVGAFAGTTAAGEFRLGAQLAQSMTKLSQMLTRAAFPEIVRSIDAGGLRRVGRMLARSVGVASIIAALVFGLVLLIGRPVLGLVGGPAYVGAYPILLWLSAAGCVDLITVGFEPVLMAVGRTGQAFLIRLAATAALVIVTVMLAPELGAIGIASAVLVYSLVMALLLALLLVRTVNGDSSRPAPVVEPEPEPR